MYTVTCLQIRSGVNHYATSNPQSAGWSALFYAAKEGHLKIAEILVEAGADVFLKDNVKLISVCRIKLRILCGFWKLRE